MNRWNSLLGATGLLLTLFLLGTPVAAQDPPPHRAGLVIVDADGLPATYCVEFAEDSIDGAELLRRAGRSLVLEPYGGLGYGVCAIDGQGCAAGQDCFCQCRTATCAYWTYSHRQPDGSWAISGIGTSAWSLRDGDVDGWVWGDGSTTPPTLSFETICPSPLAGAATAAPSNPAPETPPTAALSLQPAQSTNSSLPTYFLFGILLTLLVTLLMLGVLRRG